MPELVPIRYGRMLVSPFTFYRGAAYLMASDLAGGPRTGLHAQLCGDAHLSNFGVFAAPDRRMVFGINDFDETLPGPFEWDLKRLVASFAVAGRDRGFDRKTRAGISADGRPLLPRGDPGVRRDAQLRRLVRPRIDVEDVRPRVQRASDRRAAEAAGEEPREVEDEGQPEGVLEADRAPSTASRGSISDPPLIVPIDELAGPAEAEDARARHSGA